MVKMIDVYNYFDSYNIKHSNNGFKYLMTAVQIGVEDVEICTRITKLYEKVAEIHGTGGSNIERSIRYAIAKQNMTTKEFIIKAIFDLIVFDEARSQKLKETSVLQEDPNPMR